MKLIFTYFLILFFLKTLFCSDLLQSDFMNISKFNNSVLLINTNSTNKTDYSNINNEENFNKIEIKSDTKNKCIFN